MKTFACIALAAGLLSTPLQARDARVYEGTEASAIKCAAYFAAATHVAHQQGFVGWREAEKGKVAALVILTRHVSGTEQQKKRAFEVAIDRLPKTSLALYGDTKKYMRWCQRKFLR